jgi:hypothetical protein
MKIHIGKYTNWVGPYQIAEKILFWKSKYEDHSVHAFGEKLSNIKWLSSLCNWVESKKKRKIKIKIDPWDTWNMNDTLAMIIVPMIKQLKATQHGAPFVDDKDVPKELRSTNAEPKENEWDLDSNHFKRWEWVMDEMIWAFEQLNDNDNDAQFHSGESDIQFIKRDNGMSEMVKGPNDTHVFDMKAYQKHNKRIDNGIRLFGRYYRGLWD